MSIIDFKPVIDLVFNTVSGVVVSVLLPYAIVRALQALHINTQGAIAAQVISIAENGAALAISKAQSVADQHTTMAVSNEMVATAANYVNASAPALLTKLGVTPAHLQNIVTAQIQKQLGPVAMPVVPVVVASPAPVAPPPAPLNAGAQGPTTLLPPVAIG